jgi:transcriptional regulator with XRE-family HTH domain
MDFSERIAAVMRHYNLQAKDLADLCGVQRTAITHILNGRNRPSVGFLSQLSDAFPELNTRWLLHGRGHIFTNVTDQDSDRTHTADDLPTKPSTHGLDKPVHASVASVPKQQHAVVTSVTDSHFNLQVESKTETSTTEQSTEKSIREIIIFYKDGTFKAYRPD